MIITNKSETENTILISAPLISWALFLGTESQNDAQLVTPFNDFDNDIWSLEQMAWWRELGRFNPLLLQQQNYPFFINPFYLCIYLWEIFFLGEFWIMFHLRKKFIYFVFLVFIVFFGMLFSFVMFLKFLIR